MLDLWNVVGDVMRSDPWFTPFSASSVVVSSPVRADVEETDAAFVISAELPGVPLENVKLEIEDDVLTLTAVKRPSENGDRRGLHAERRYGTFARAFSLPKAVDREAVRATMQHGVLTITLPKAERARARQIPIRVAAIADGESAPRQITTQGSESTGGEPA